MKSRFPLIIVLAVILGVLPTWGAVLCIAEDGHFALELNLGDSLNADPCGAGKPADALCCLEAANGDDACKDVSIVVSLITSRFQSQERFSQLLTAVLLPVFHFAALPAPAPKQGDATPCHSPGRSVLLEIASTVLLV